MKKNNKKGFTLVELVIVIAVIAVLSAILVPTFGNVISGANKNARMENAGIAYRSFLVENCNEEIIDKDAYIIFTKSNVSSITSANTVDVYAVKGGTKSSNISAVFSAINSTETTPTSIAIKEVGESDTNKYKSGEAYSLGNDMYIVFAA